MMIGALLGIALGLGSIYYSYAIVIALVFCAVIGMFYLNEYSEKPCRDFYIAGVFFHSISMWWLAPTISRFGGFSFFPSLGLLILYVLLSSIQFPLVVCLLRKYTQSTIERAACFVVFWMLCEMYFPRLFPWGLSHFFIELNYISSFAEYVGSYGVSLIVLFISACTFLLSINIKRVSHWYLMGYVSIVFLILGVGAAIDIKALSLKPHREISALVVQGNLSTEKKGKQEFLQANISEYVQLSHEAVASAPVDLIIWPESVVAHWTDVASTRSEVLDTYAQLPSVPLLYGGLGYRRAREPKYFNIAFVRNAEGNLVAHYGKRTLMPFGEYVPFADVFPWLKKLVPIGAGFSVGETNAPIGIPLEEEVVKAGVLICYEDMIADQGREFALQEADVLINLTNDAWYGESPAASQHDLLARYRSIETRKTLLRATNTGLTTVINHRGGRDVALPMFVSAAKTVHVPLYKIKTFYAIWGDLLLWVGIVMSAIVSLAVRFKK